MVPAAKKAGVVPLSEESRAIARTRIEVHGLAPVSENRGFYPSRSSRIVPNVSGRIKH